MIRSLIVEINFQECYEDQKSWVHLVNNLTNNQVLKIKDKFKKSKLSKINSFQPGEGLCIKPNNPITKYV